MQQVRTHFSTAYELPLLTRAENYAQVSPLAQLSPVTPVSTAGAGRRRARPRSLSLAVGDLECWGSVFLCCDERHLRKGVLHLEGRGQVGMHMEVWAQDKASSVLVLPPSCVSNPPSPASLLINGTI